MANGPKQKQEPLGWPLIRLALIVVLGGVAPLLDTTIVNVALHTLEHEFRVDTATVQWVTTVYLLALTVTIPATVWATHRFGSRRLWLVGLALFLVGSAASGLSWSIGSLILFRAIQGIGAGIIQPVVQTILVRAAGPSRLGRVLTIVTIVTLIAPIAGPVAGGAIIASASWRLVFFVNVPICIAALALAAVLLPRDERGTARPFDAVGLLLLAPGLVGIIYGLSNATTSGALGSARVLVPLGAGVALMLTFVIRSLRSAGPKLLDLAVFRIRSFTTASGILFFSGFSLYGALLLVPLYFQQLRGQDALTAGLLLAPQGIGSLLTRWVGGFVDRIGARPFAIGGIVLAALATIPFAVAGSGTSELVLAGALVVRGAGLSAANIAIVTGAFRDVPREEVPGASALTRLLQQLGGSLGTAVLAVILVAASRPGAPAAGFQTAFWWSIALTVAALVPAILIPSRRAAAPVPTE